MSNPRFSRHMLNKDPKQGSALGSYDVRVPWQFFSHQGIPKISVPLRIQENTSDTPDGSIKSILRRISVGDRTTERTGYRKSRLTIVSSGKVQHPQTHQLGLWSTLPATGSWDLTEVSVGVGCNRGLTVSVLIVFSYPNLGYFRLEVFYQILEISVVTSNSDTYRLYISVSQVSNFLPGIVKGVWIDNDSFPRFIVPYLPI